MQHIALAVIGTRPEAIKMAPVILALKAEGNIEVVVVATGQHREMLNDTLSIFEIIPNFDLAIMRPNQSISYVVTPVISGLDPVLEDIRPSWVLVHGDTTTAMAASIAAFNRGFPVGHVEAGLRTGDLSRPFPEEFNRRCVDIVAEILWAPTAGAKANLLAEALPSGKRIIVTGNTAIDALQWASARLDSDPKLRDAIDKGLPVLQGHKKMVLVTGHRRESFGSGFENICQALRSLALRSDIEIVYPVHLNPNVAGPIYNLLGGLQNIHLIVPQDYLAFVRLMQCAALILTDSGGVQEEGPSLSKPVLVMRDVTERPEAIKAGTAKLVGTSSLAIIAGVTELLDDARKSQTVAGALNPYGDGRAAERIVQSLLTEGKCIEFGA
jgi:UDP-N-acetylglucosamine 2-epimerase (non-hydrolysing)